GAGVGWRVTAVVRDQWPARAEAGGDTALVWAAAGPAIATKSPNTSSLLVPMPRTSSARKGYRGRARVTNRTRSLDQPVQHSKRQPDQAPHDRAVQTNELQVGTNPLLDLGDQPAGFDRLEVLAHGETDLVVVAAQEVVGRRAHPAVEDRAPLRVVEQIEDAAAELAVD